MDQIGHILAISMLGHSRIGSTAFCSIIIVGAAILSAGCNSERAVGPSASQSPQLPVVTGFTFTSLYGYVLGSWGNPEEAAHVYPPYPNPFNGSVSVDFLTADHGTVIIDVFPARLLEEDSENLLSMFGGTFVNENSACVAHYEYELDQGVHSMLWVPGDLPGGAYCIYVTTDDYSERQFVLNLPTQADFKKYGILLPDYNQY